MSVLCGAILLLAAVLLQTAVFPALLPAVLRPDVGLLMSVAALSFGRRSFGYAMLFLLGLQADLFGSERFGLLTLSYMLSGGLLMCVAWRELARGEMFTAWIGGVGATLMAHLLYVLLGRWFLGLELGWGGALAGIAGLLLSAVIWGLPCLWLCGGLMFRTWTVTPAIRERWLGEMRLAAARRGKAVRFS